MTVNEALQIFSAVGALVVGVWALLKIVVTQFERRLDARFDAMEKARDEGRLVWEERFKGMEGRLGVQERDLSSLLTALPNNFQRREDAIRSDVQLNAKLDAINHRLDLWIERWSQGSKS